jgi:hypothetical protein
VLPVLSTNAQMVGVGHDTAADRDSKCPTPGSAGFAATAGAGASGVGADQLVPFPSLTCPDPSTITQEGPDVQVMAGRIGALTGPLAAAG